MSFELLYNSKIFFELSTLKLFLILLKKSKSYKFVFGNILIKLDFLMSLVRLNKNFR